MDRTLAAAAAAAAPPWPPLSTDPPPRRRTPSPPSPPRRRQVLLETMADTNTLYADHGLHQLCNKIDDMNARSGVKGRRTSNTKKRGNDRCASFFSSNMIHELSRKSIYIPPPPRPGTDNEPLNPVYEGKLVLVLDLDNTLLHSIDLDELTVSEAHLLDRSSSDISLWLPAEPSTKFTVKSMPVLTKLRPYIHTFLKDVGTMFDLFIYTKARRNYAQGIANILDPDGLHFTEDKIISGDEKPQHASKKNLSLVPRNHRHVIIVDDLSTVWEDHIDNLIHIDQYNYFAGCRKHAAPLSLMESGKDEAEDGGALAGVLDTLHRAHATFFTDPKSTALPLTLRDVRPILGEIKQQQISLKGCRSGVAEH